MYPLGHYGMALLFAAPSARFLSKRRSALVALLALLVSTAPDMDLFVPYTHHHGGMHTVLFMIVGSAAVGLAFTAISAGYRMALRDRLGTPVLPEREVFRLTTASFAVGIGSHLVADAIAIPIAENLLRPFWPLSDVVVEFYLIYPGDPLWNVGVFAAGLAVQAALMFDLPNAVADRASGESGS